MVKISTKSAHVFSKIKASPLILYFYSEECTFLVLNRDRNHGLAFDKSRSAPGPVSALDPHLDPHWIQGSDPQ